MNLYMKIPNIFRKSIDIPLGGYFIIVLGDEVNEDKRSSENNRAYEKGHSLV